MVIAIIKPYRLDEVRDAIKRNSANGLTIFEAKGHGRQKGHTALYKGAEYVVELVPKLVVATIIPEDREKRLLKDIKEAARTDKIGDGIVFSFPLESYERIRTGELITDETY